MQRAVQTKIFIEVEEQKEEQEKDIKELLKEYEQTSKEYEEWVQIQLEDQGQQIEEKIRQRRRQRKKRANSISEEQFLAKFKAIDELPETSAWQEGVKQVKFQEDSQPKSQASVRSQKQDKIISEIEESMSFMRKSIQRMSQRRSQKMHKKGAVSQGILKNCGGS